MKHKINSFTPLSTQSVFGKLLADMKKDKQKSKAGRIGASCRWGDHEKIPTKLTRIYTDDFNYLADLSANSGYPVVLLVHRCIQHIRDKHGYSALWSPYIN